MPLTIAGVALLGWWVAGLAPAVALLLGAVLAPTDPVLASDVQVGEPLTDDIDDPDDEEGHQEDDDIRFALTAEAGLNDGLAFPFVHLALLLLAGGFTALDAGAWLGWYVLGKIALGVLGRPRASGGCSAARPSTPSSDNLRLADAGRAPPGARRTAGGVRRRGAGRRLRLPRRLHLRDDACAPPSAGTPTSARCTPWSSGSNG